MDACEHVVWKSLVDYSNVKTHDIWEGNVITGREIWTEHIRSLGFGNTRKEATLWRSRCTCKLIQNKFHKKNYHNDIKHHMTPNTKFSAMIGTKKWSSKESSRTVEPFWKLVGGSNSRVQFGPKLFQIGPFVPGPFFLLNSGPKNQTTKTADDTIQPPGKIWLNE